MNELPLIERRQFFENPDRASVQISPDGAYLSWLAPLDGVLNVWVAPVGDVTNAQALTRDFGRGIRHYGWAKDGRHLLYLQDTNGDENERLYAVDLSNRSTRDLTPFDGAKAILGVVSHKFPDEVVVHLNNRDPQWHDVYRIHLVTGEMTLILQNDRFAEVLVDDDYCLQAGFQMTDAGGQEIYIPLDGGWRHWDSIAAEDFMTTGVIGPDKTNQLFYMRDSRRRDTSALVEVNIETKHSRLLAGDIKCDVSNVLCHPTEKHIQAVSFIYARKRWEVLDPSLETDFARLSTVSDGDFEINSRSLNDQVWVVSYVVDDGPVRFYLHDRNSGVTTFLFTSRRALEELPLAKMRSFTIEARDGLNLLGYYSLPPGSDTNNDGIPDHPLPMVFTPHGGPWGRDRWGFHGWHQWLANRGYAVLSVNFRASTGFGKAFVNAGNLESGGKIIDDQVDAVEWSIRAGISDPKRIAVMGISFGGYSVLAGLTFNPELFACGVDLVGISNLVTCMESIPEYWKPAQSMFANRVGDHRTEEGRALLRKHSPLTYVDRICRPLLIGQGANDPRVKKEESEQIVGAMQAIGLPVTYVLYPDEGHGFVRPENNLSFYAIAESFLAVHLGGRLELIRDDFAGSSLEVLAGAEDIPGLQEALAREA